MVTKKKTSSTNKASETKVTRLKATDDKPAVTEKTSTKVIGKQKSPKVKKEKSAKKTRRNPLKAILRYFKGAWVELKQVRWPNRKATWSLTIAVLAFTGFFVLLIVLLDALFNYLLRLIIG